MPLPFSLPTRPSLPSLAWAMGNQQNASESSDTKTDNKGIRSPPPKTSSAASSLRRLSGSRSIRRTSIVVSRPTTPANPSPVSAGFGLPGVEEDDPFGVLALQKAGLHIKEAGTQHRPGSEAFQYRPAPSSPIWRSSMASAMSGRTGRPSMDGRSSILTGRRSAAHSRQSSAITVGTINTMTTVDMSTQTLDLEPDRQSMRETSPAEESPSRRTSPEGRNKRSPDSNRRSRTTKPDALQLLNDNDLKRIDETPSPRFRLPVVDEDAQEEPRKGGTDVEKVTEKTDLESDLDRLARELREMADEHEEEQQRSQGSRTDRADSAGDVVALDSVEEESDDVKTPQRLSVRSTARATAHKITNSTQSAKLVALEADQTPSVQRIVEIRTPDEDDEDDEDEEDDDDSEEDEYDSFDDEEEPVIIEQAVQAAAPVTLRPRHLGTASLQARAQIVSVHLPPPPKVPSRNPRRTRQFESSEMTGSDCGDGASSPASSHDNDSTSTYSLDRDSFDDGQDIMTQTSQGSEIGSTEVTPTREKALESISGEVERSLSAKMRRMSSKDSEHSNEDARIIIDSPTSDKSASDSLPTPQADDSGRKELAFAVENDKAEEVKGLTLEPPAPSIPDRRRPFSFEVGASEEDYNSLSLNATLHTEKLDSSDGARKSSDNSDSSHTASGDDHSVYEEDFS